MLLLAIGVGASLNLKTFAPFIIFDPSALGFFDPFIFCYTDFRSVALNGYGFSRPFRLMRVEYFGTSSCR